MNAAPKYAPPRDGTMTLYRLAFLAVGGALMWASGICAGLWIAGAL